MHAPAPRPSVLDEEPKLTPTRVAVPEDTHEYWLDALHRCGVHAIRGISASSASVAFVPPASRVSDEVIQALHRARVAIVGDGRVAEVLCNTPVRRQRLSGIRGDGRLFGSSREIRMPTTVRSADSLVTVSVDGPAPVVALPLPTADALLAVPPSMREFEVAADVDVREFVSGCDHGGIRRLLQNALGLALRLHRLPFARLGIAPTGYSGVLGIRIDADGFDPEATAAVVDSLARAGLHATWFIDVERHEAKRGARAVRELVDRGHEVQSHFYHHYTYRSAKRNRRNLARSRAVLRDWGLEISAAATPFGSFHSGVRAALAAEGIEWSSEFSAIYDDLPSICHGSVQVPVHPVCPILLLEAGLNEQDVHEYYTSRLRQNLVVGECSIFYGHPIRDLAAVPDLFVELRKALTEHETESGQPVWQPTLGAFKAFHDHRRRLLSKGEFGEDAPPVVVEYPEGSADDKAALEITCEPWVPRDPRSLRRRQRNVRFRRWLREVRHRRPR